MEKLTTIEGIKGTLKKSGFNIFEYCKGGCFDIVARRDEFLLFIKVLTNIDAVNNISMNELKILANFFDGVPLVIGERSSSGKIKDSALYLRYNVPIMSKKTFDDILLEYVQPFIYASPGGFYVQLSGETIRKIRKKKKISLGKLAEVAGVSRKAIQMYEKGMGTNVDIALRIENFLGISVIIPMNVFSRTETIDNIEIDMTGIEQFERLVFKYLSKLGCEIIPTRKCPFEALAKVKNNTLLTGISRYNHNLIRKASFVTSISKVTKSYYAFFVKDTDEKSIGGVPLIAYRELKRMSSSDDVMEIILERKEEDGI